MTRVKTQSPTWRQRGRSLMDALATANAAIEELTAERNALRLRVAGLLNDLEAAQHALAVQAVASPAAPQAEATPSTAIADELTAEAQKLGLYEEQS